MVSNCASRSCCTRITDVAAAMASAGPNRSAQICAARRMGSKPRSSGRGTGRLSAVGP